MTLWGHLRMPDRNNPLTGKPRMRARTAGLALALGVALVIGGIPAEAHQSPAGCTGNSVTVELEKDVAGLITNGQTVTYTLRVVNPGPTCDATNLQVQGFCPDATGAPTILNTTFPIIASVPSGTDALVGTFSCVVTVNAGVTVATAKDTFSGILHDLPNADDTVDGSKTLSVNLEGTPPPPPPPVNQIPTLSEWVMIMIAVFLALAGGVALRRKRIA